MHLYPRTLFAHPTEVVNCKDRCAVYVYILSTPNMMCGVNSSTRTGPYVKTLNAETLSSRLNPLNRRMQ